MIACGALNPEEPKNLMAMTRRFIARAGLTQNDVDMLRGVCAAIIRPKADRVGGKQAQMALQRAQSAKKNVLAH